MFMGRRPNKDLAGSQPRLAPQGCDYERILGSAELRQSAGEAWAVQFSITSSIQSLLRAAASEPSTAWC